MAVASLPPAGWAGPGQARPGKPLWLRVYQILVASRETHPCTRKPHRTVTSSPRACGAALDAEGQRSTLGLLSSTPATDSTPLVSGLTTPSLPVHRALPARMEHPGLAGHQMPPPPSGSTLPRALA